MTFSKTVGGIYSTSLDISSDFVDLISATIVDYTALPNLAFMPRVASNLTNGTSRLGLLVSDPSNPSTLTFSSGSIVIRVVIAK